MTTAAQRERLTVRDVVIHLERLVDDGVEEGLREANPAVSPWLAVHEAAYLKRSTTEGARRAWRPGAQPIVFGSRAGFGVHA